MRISEAAKITGLSVSNIRFYEKKGLLSPETVLKRQETALFLLCAVFPSVAIWSQFHREGGPQAAVVVFWIVWALGLMYAFYRFRKLNRRKNRGCAEE